MGTLTVSFVQNCFTQAYIHGKYIIKKMQKIFLVREVDHEIPNIQFLIKYLHFRLALSYYAMG